MPHDKYEDEIRDILNKMDDFVPDGEDRPRPRPKAPPPWSGWVARMRLRLNGYDSTTFMAAMVMLALGGWLLHKIYPPFGAIAALGSVACLLIAIGLPMISRRYGTTETRWRGKVIDYEPYRIRRSGSTWQYVWWRIKKFFGLR
jgi:di/tricarboxylate transporter